jgi:hypothetical protein
LRFLSLGKNELDFPLREEEALYPLYFWEYDCPSPKLWEY